MERKQINPDISAFPAAFHDLLYHAKLYDSSCSRTAQVVFIDRDGGYYLKSAAKGMLKAEAELGAFFHKKQLAPEVISYLSEEKDWLLTAKAEGEDCTHRGYLDHPEKLCDTIAELLRRLHSIDPAGCPVADRTASYLATAEQNYHSGMYDTSLLPDNWGFASADEAWKVIQNNGPLLKKDTLLHGDYCLPNIMLDDWKFSAFIDLGNGGVGDRHIDLFWGLWSLAFNLKTNKYQERFFDAYGRSDIEPEMLKTIAAFEVFG